MVYVIGDEWLQFCGGICMDYVESSGDEWLSLCGGICMDYVVMRMYLHGLCEIQW